MDKEALGDVSYSIDTAKEIISIALMRLEDCGLNEMDYSTIRSSFSRATESLDIARKVLENAEED